LHESRQFRTTPLPHDLSEPVRVTTHFYEILSLAPLLPKTMFSWKPRTRTRVKGGGPEALHHLIAVVPIGECPHRYGTLIRALTRVT
jgi:hypothetical protein